MNACIVVIKNHHRHSLFFFFSFFIGLHAILNDIQKWVRKRARPREMMLNLNLAAFIHRLRSHCVRFYCGRVYVSCVVRPKNSNTLNRTNEQNNYLIANDCVESHKFHWMIYWMDCVEFVNLHKLWTKCFFFLFMEVCC